MGRVLSLLTSFGFMLLGLLALPFLLVLRFGFMKNLTKSLFSGLTDISLSEPEYRDRITFQEIETTPSIEAHDAVITETQSLIENDDWLALSDKMMGWDQKRASCEAGIPFSGTAMWAVISSLADQVCEGHSCHPDPIAILSVEVAEKLETLAALHSSSYPLLAMAAEVRCHQGWYTRGADYAQYVSDDGWFGMASHFSKAEWLLDRVDPVAMNSPLLAAARHKLLAFMPEADRYARPFYEEWSALDPKDQAPHHKHAIMMLPRWFGSAETLQIEAQKAVVRTQETTREAAYFSMYRTVFNDWDPNVLEVDLQALKQGAYDLASLRKNDPAFVAGLLQETAWWVAIGADNLYREEEQARWAEVADGIHELRANLVRNHLTAIHANSWEYGVDGALGEISTLFQKEITEGASFQMDKGGLTILSGA